MVATPPTTWDDSISPLRRSLSSEPASKGSLWPAWEGCRRISPSRFSRPEWRPRRPQKSAERDRSSWPLAGGADRSKVLGDCSPVPPAHQSDHVAQPAQHTGLHARRRRSRVLRSVPRRMGRPMPFDPEPMVERMGGGRGSRGLRPEIRRVINSTNTIESLSTSEGNKSQRPLPHLTGRDERRYPVVRSLDPTDLGRALETLSVLAFTWAASSEARDSIEQDQPPDQRNQSSDGPGGRAAQRITVTEGVLFVVWPVRSCSCRIRCRLRTASRRAPVSSGRSTIGTSRDSMDCRAALC